MPKKTKKEKKKLRKRQARLARDRERAEALEKEIKYVESILIPLHETIEKLRVGEGQNLFWNIALHGTVIGHKMVQQIHMQLCEQRQRNGGER